MSMAWWIVEEETGLSRAQIITGCKDTTFSPHMQEIVDRLLHFEPIQYIFGHTLWNGLDLKVTPATLIPRPETAELVERIINQLSEFSNQPSAIRNHKHKSEFRVLDVGTGSGCIAIALKKAHPEWQVTGIDISPEAIEVAKENARRNNVDVNFHVADIFSDSFHRTPYTVHHTPNSQQLTANSQQPPFPFLISLSFERLIHLSSFNLLVSNPPYIRESEKSTMRPNVLNYEPSTALFVPDSDPLRFYRRIAELFSPTPYTLHPTPYTVHPTPYTVHPTPYTLHPTPYTGHPTPKYLFFEINESFSQELSAMLTALGYTDVTVTRDIYGKPRIIECRSSA